MKLSVLIIAKNEEKNIEPCIKSVKFADEIILIDDNSKDDTVTIAKKLGVKVYERPLQNNFAEQQNYAISKSSGEWLLFIDCDERITKNLSIAILNKINLNKKFAYKIKRRNYFANKRVYFGSMRADYVCRLIPRENIRFEGLVHQNLIHHYKTKKIKQPMLHYTYESWEEYYDKLNKYSKISAIKYIQNDKNNNFFFNIFIRPIWAFFKMYIIHLGFLDGKIGLVLAINHSFYTYTKYVRISKIL